MGSETVGHQTKLVASVRHQHHPVCRGLSIAEQICPMQVGGEASNRDWFPPAFEF